MRHRDGSKNILLQADLGVCNRCHGVSRIQHCAFYWYIKGEGVYEGDFCLSCLTKIVLQSTLWNLVFGLWTVWGIFAGPIFVVINAVKYLKCIVRFT
jgi:hypothetical protein